GLHDGADPGGRRWLDLRLKSTGSLDMNSTILLYLAHDAVINGLIYALLGIAALMVFLVTRVLFVPQGELVAFAALSMVALQDGRVPGTTTLLVMLGVICAVVRLVRERKHQTLQTLMRMLGLE